MIDKKIICIFILLVTITATIGCFESTETIVIGGKPFNEQYILGEMISILLTDAGYQTELKSSMNDATLFEGIKKEQVDVYVEYTGTAFSQLLKYDALDTWDPEVVYNQVVTGLEENGIIVLFKIGFRDDYAIAVKESWAEENNVGNISDLQPFASNLILGSDLVFHEREDGLLNLEEKYNISFKDVKPMQPTLMYQAIDTGEVDVIPPYTTDTRVDRYNLTILTDDQKALPPYETMLLTTETYANDDTFVSTLSVLENRIDTDTMRELNAEFDIDQRDAYDIAYDYLVEEGLIS